MESSCGRATSELAPRRPSWRRFRPKMHSPREALMPACSAAPSTERTTVFVIAFPDSAGVLRLIITALLQESRRSNIDCHELVAVDQ